MCEVVSRSCDTYFFLKWRDSVSKCRDGVTECNCFDLCTYFFICFEIRVFYYYFNRMSVVKCHKAIKSYGVEMLAKTG